MKKLIVGNWKMNLLSTQVLDLISQIKLGEFSSEVVICPPFPYLAMARHILVGNPIKLGAQNCHWAFSGAHTGDVSAAMLKDMGCEYVILGHSERRQSYKESSQTVQNKVKIAHEEGLKSIVCIGETEEENGSGRTKEVIVEQIRGSIPQDMSSENLVVAYEPIWAIGTGRVPTTDDILSIHTFIREQLQVVVENAVGVRIVYGGSVGSSNAAEILALNNVDGVLVGGASLKAAEFNEIIRLGG